MTEPYIPTLETAKRITQWWDTAPKGPDDPGRPEEGRFLIVWGDLGVGKSVYQLKVGMQALRAIYGLTEEEAWERVKEHLVFTPDQFLDRIYNVRQRIPFVLWDDAGLWLPSIAKNDPFLLNFTLWTNIARTSIGALILSTPSPQLILKKVRLFPGTKRVKIVHYPNNPQTDRWWEWRRKAEVSHFYSRKGEDSMVSTKIERKTDWTDTFYCRLPDTIYSWYQPLRQSYADAAWLMLKEAWETTKGRSAALREIGAMPTLKAKVESH